MRKALLALALAAAFTHPSAAATLAAASDPDRVEGTSAATGAAIAEAWLIAPTQRYDHLVRGNSAEAGGLRLRLTSGEILTLLLDPEHVFEDSGPRLADFDGDGIEEIALVLSSLKRGASLALYSVTPDGIVQLAATPYIGQPHRWLNPAGISDFDGDGQLDIALVQMPHLQKRLEFWTLAGSALTRLAAVADVANHRYGSPHTRMSAVADFNGDGIVDLAVPDGSRTAIRFLTLTDGTPRDLGIVPLPAPADGDFTLANSGTISVPLETGGVVTVRLP